MTNPIVYLDDKRMELLSLSRDLERSLTRLLEKKEQERNRLSAVLEAVSPLKVIAKGYSVVFAQDGSLVRSVEGISVGDAISLRMADGIVDTHVTAINKTEKKDKL